MSDRLPFGFTPGGGSGGSGGAGGSGEGIFGTGAPFFAELEKLLSWQGGPVNWELARQLAIRASADGDRPVTPAETAAVTESIRLADLWLDPTTTLPSGVQSVQAWSRAEWIEATVPVWRSLCDPVAGRVVEAMGTGLSGSLEQLKNSPELAEQLPPGIDLSQLSQLSAGGGPFLGIINQVGGLLFGAQVGQAIGALAGDTVSSTEIGLPLGPAGQAALLPAAIATFGEGLGVGEDEVRLYLALREAAHHRLYGHVPWLRSHVLSAIEDYARGITVDPEAIGRTLSQIDPTRLDPESLQQMLGEGVFDDPTTPQQQAALRRLETVLALVEGWVDEVVDAAARDHLPSAAALRETLRRRRATGGPAEQTFAALVGLELRPRRLREAAALWSALREARGLEGRDAIWAHPDLLPGADDLDDPAAFLASSGDSNPVAEIESLDDEPPTENS
jgi:putative hydrolase